MQTNNYQEEIRKLLDAEGLINKELTFGCKILSPSGEASLVRVFGQDNPDKDHYPRYCFSYEQESKNHGMATFVSDNFYADCKVLGHPWDLREVMVWFGKQKLYTKLFDDGKFEVLKSGLNFAEIDLSTPLSQQDLKPLFELMLSLKK